ncbi:META domain-containing protein [Photobacterium toruni]|uniref:META domain-containing protein n=1 Tax=Photobacterium toruni TaxID=1935446 RepID=UPI0021107C0B|nr:META domain-containing protein [Photobacterium toruni]
MSRKKIYLASLLLIVGCSTKSDHDVPDFIHHNKEPIVKGKIDYSGVYAVNLQGYKKYENIAPVIQLHRNGDHYQISASFGCNTISGGINVENNRLVTVKGDDVVRGKSMCPPDITRKENRFISILNGGSAIIEVKEIEYDNNIFERR